MAKRKNDGGDQRAKIGGGVLLSEKEASQAAHLLRILLAEHSSKRRAPSDSDMGLSPGHLQYLARRSYALRLARLSRFSSKLFGEPAWDMSLALYAIRPDASLSSTEVIKLSTAAPSTGLRYLDLLTKESLIVRTRHPTDRRLTLISLSKKGRRLLDEHFFEAVETGLAQSG